MVQVLALRLDGPKNAFKEAWRKYNVSLNRQPLIAKAVTSAVGHFIGDIMGQTAERVASKGQKEFDSGRLFRMTTFGLLINGPWAHYWYHYLDKLVFPANMKHPAVVVLKAILDQSINAPVGTIMFYACITALENNVHMVMPAIKEKTMPTLYANWKVWPTVHLLNFAVIPPKYRILYVNFVALFWRAFLSVYGNNRACIQEEIVAKEHAVQQQLEQMPPHNFMMVQANSELESESAKKDA